jgi:hypothetical protein
LLNSVYPNSINTILTCGKFWKTKDKSLLAKIVSLGFKGMNCDSLRNSAEFLVVFIKGG